MDRKRGIPFLDQRTSGARRAQGPIARSSRARVGPSQRGAWRVTRAWRAWRGVARRVWRRVARVCPLVIDGSTELPPRPTMRTGGVPGYQARPAVLGICGEPIKGCRPLAGDYCTAFQLCFGANQGGGGSAGGERQRVRLPDRSTSIFERSRGLQSDCPWMGKRSLNPLG